MEVVMKAVLFDLDGTLLPMDTDKFTKLYGKSLMESFHDFDDVEKIFPQVMKSIYKTVMNKEHKTNYNIFFDDFEKNMTGDRDVYINRFDEFYINGFEKVKPATSVSEDIVTAVDILKEKGYKLIIATNPIFPMAANKKRIEWAGLDITKFDHVTSFEKNHYCKPHIEFYEEVLLENNLEGKDVLMVGNDVQEDLAIKALGAKTYLIDDHIVNRLPDQTIKSDFRGSYSDFLSFVKGL